MGTTKFRHKLLWAVALASIVFVRVGLGAGHLGAEVPVDDQQDPPSPIKRFQQLVLEDDFNAEVEPIVPFLHGDLDYGHDVYNSTGLDAESSFPPASQPRNTPPSYVDESALAVGGVCPECECGKLIKKSGPFGEFVGCTCFRTHSCCFTVSTKLVETGITPEAIALRKELRREKFVEANGECSLSHKWNVKNTIWYDAEKTTAKVIYYRCSTLPKRACAVTRVVKFDADGIVSSDLEFGNHEHEPLSVASRKLSSEKSEEFKQSFRSGKSAQEVYISAVNNAQNPLDGAEVPTQKHLQYLRRCVQNEDLPTDSELQNLLSVHANIILDLKMRASFSTDMTIIFSRPELLELLPQYGNDVFFIDGTHKLLDTGSQLVSILVRLPSGRGCPIAYAVTARHTPETYQYILQTLSNQVPAWQPKYFMADFERAIYIGATSVFPGCLGVGCLFHFMQTLRRWMAKAKYGIATIQKVLEQARLVYVQSTVDAFNAQCRVFLAYCKEAVTAPFRAYFEKYFVGTPNQPARFPPSQWGYFTHTGIPSLENETTNNIAESNNRSLKQLIPHLGLGYTRFAGFLSEQLTFHAREAERDIAGIVTAKRNKQKAPTRIADLVRTAKANEQATIEKAASLEAPPSTQKTRGRKKKVSPTNPIVVSSDDASIGTASRGKKRASSVTPITISSDDGSPKRPRSRASAAVVSPPPSTVSPPPCSTSPDSQRLVPSIDDCAEIELPDLVVKPQNIPMADKITERTSTSFHRRRYADPNDLALTLQGMELSLVSMEADGNCCFRMYLRLLGCPDHEVADRIPWMRSVIAAYMDSRPDIFEDWCVDDGGLARRTHHIRFNLGRSVSGWGGHDTHLAFAMHFNVDLVVLTAYASTKSQLCRLRYPRHGPQADQLVADDNANCVVGAYIGENHYAVVVPFDGA
eukprot:TRINITY_DN421_c0_g2_i14.p1 TRINITY_DN421_c0_g2~~TRINITY_DN421_c0_g2_i14.p1  ORF type:complete len:923 (+),score=6.54 TRINITY_DN421_c0_g2_i14:333-3101(+)